MNIDYLYSIIKLYLKKENDELKINTRIVKKEDNIEININMKEDDFNKTTFYIPFDTFQENLDNLINMYKENTVVTDEKYNYDKNSDKCDYYVNFKNGRKISFENLSIEYLNNIRNSIYKNVNNGDYQFINNDITDYLANYQNNIQPAYTGFASFKSILLISIFFLIVLILSIVFFMK